MAEVPDAIEALESVIRRLRQMVAPASVTILPHLPRRGKRYVQSGKNPSTETLTRPILSV